MAHTAAINASIAELADTLISADSPQVRRRRAKDVFARQVKSHSYARTNQFEIAEKLAGLEEKFQIFNRDELSDALRMRRDEADKQEIPWIPDVLDLLLRLSVDPVKYSHLEQLDEIEQRPEEAPALTWADVEATDPIDRRDPIWKQQDYSDFSSDDDEDIETDAPLIPNRGKRHSNLNPSSSNSKWLYTADQTKSELLMSGNQRFWEVDKGKAAITELQAVRETLFMLQGLDTALFEHMENRIISKKNHRFAHASQELLSEALNSLAAVGTDLYRIREWLSHKQSLRYMQALRDSIINLLQIFDRSLADMHSTLLRPRREVVVSITRLEEDIKPQAAPLLVVAKVLQDHDGDGTVGILDALFNEIGLLQLSGNDIELANLSIVFLCTLRAYLQPIDAWLGSGAVDPHLDGFFVKSGVEDGNPSLLWSEWCMMDSDALMRQTPSFIQPYAEQIVTSGKTAMFLKHLGRQPRGHEAILAEATQQLLTGTDGDLLPFSERLHRVIQTEVTAYLQSTSKQLKSVLEHDCGLWATLQSLEHLYFGKLGPITEAIDAKIFGRIDACNESWNDRFLTSELFHDRFEGKSIDFDRVVVHAKHTSSRKMTTRRQSVKLLGDLSLEYVLSWPLANIMPQSTMASYRRIALLLMQIRRARFALVRRAHFFVHNGLLYLDSGERKFAQGLQHSLLLFTDVLYDHLTASVIEPAGSRLKRGLEDSLDVEAMITISKKYATELEEACLTQKKFAALHDAIVTILDLCLRFSDVVSMPTSVAGRRSSDFETSSFVSAASHRRRRKRRQQEDLSSDEADGEEVSEGEGYSSFVVLEDTTPSEEVHRIQQQFQRQHHFLVAALRGIFASGGKSEQGLSWELLADRLNWKQSRVRPA